MAQENHKEIMPPGRPQYIVINVFKQQNLTKRIGNPNTLAHNSALPECTPRSLNVFIQCLMLMVFTMFMFTGIIVLYVLVTPDIKTYLARHAFYVIALSLFIFLFIDYAFVCTYCSRRAPCNFYFLCVTVFALSAILATVSAVLDTKVLLYAILSVAVTVLVGAFLSCTKFDFASHFLYVVFLGTALSVIIILVVIIGLVTGNFVNVLWLLVLIIATFIQVAMLTLQLQTILGGRTIQIRENDFAIGAFMLYAAVIDVFLKVLQIAGVTRDIDDNR